MPLFAPFVAGLCRLATVAVLTGAISLSAAPVLADAAAPLVSTAWLKAHLDEPDVVVLDVRSGGGGEAYAKAHIRGAVHSDYDKAGWRVSRNGVPFMLPTTAELEKLIGDLGIDEDSHVVVVPAGLHVLDFGSAARIYWTAGLPPGRPTRPTRSRAALAAPRPGSSPQRSTGR
jgi:thiosulfate/3-mercaptopyruvate sulfurtransferase